MENCMAHTDIDPNMSEHIEHETALSQTETHLGKRVVKLSVKARAERLEKLQNSRKSKLNKAGDLRESIKQLKEEGKLSDVQILLGDFIKLCDEINGVHISIVGLLPEEEKEKHEVWFKAKMMFNNDVIKCVKQWVLQNQVDKNENDCQEDINPDDSISNIEKHTNKSVASSRSSTSSVKIKAATEKAALLARMATLKEKYALDEQELLLKRRKEQLQIETELAEATAKLEVLQFMEERRSTTKSDGMNSYLNQEKRRASSSFLLNPKAKEYKPLTQDDKLSEQGNHQIGDIKPKHKTSECLKQCNVEQQQPLQSNESAETTIAGQQHQINDQHLSSSIVTIIEKQSKITEELVHHQLCSTLPSRDIPIFDGDPLQYHHFKRAFEQGIEEKASKSDCMYYLEQFTRGQPRELVRSCQHMAPESGYKAAKHLLKEHFGNEYKIAAAYMDKVLAWQSIKSEDAKALQAYALYLRGCCNVMQELDYMEELNMPSNLKIIVSKLPFKLREGWRTKAHDILEQCNRRAQLQDLVIFLERHVKILTDPIYGDIEHVQSKTSCFQPSKLKQQRPGGSKGSFATTIKAVSSSNKHVLGDLHEGLCCCCSNAHKLENCQIFRSKKHRDKISFLKDKGVCFGCLSFGHISRYCTKRLNCETCGQQHPSVLHIIKPSEHLSLSPVKLVSTLTQTCGHTGAGKGDCLLSIVPVKVRSMEGNKVVQTYAFLDPGSSATFCTEQLMQKLQIKGKKTQFLLTTMGQEKVVPAHLLHGLEIAGLGDSTFHLLPEVLTQNQVPVSKANIATNADLKRWPYLSKIDIPNINAAVDMLIGTNAPKLLEPWEVINSEADGPYAIRTVLGWVINGPLQGNGTVAVVNRISVSNLELMLQNQYNHDFNEKPKSDKGMSREDLKFKEMMDSTLVLQNNRYVLNLPLKNAAVTLPNNYSVAKQRILALRKKFMKNTQFYQEYGKFLENVINRGYAEKVPDSELEGKTGKVWYIPHHGVYHPKKGSLRVVFDCGATFKGRSLNAELLQGPNLTSSLLGVLRFRQKPVACMGDIQAMFHQVKVVDSHKDLLRFLWWKDGDYQKEIQNFRMTVHLFGAVSSPSCASYALRKTADDNRGDFSEAVIQAVEQNFYVDDCLMSFSSEEEAKEMMKDISALCKRGGFILEKWVSNNREVLQSLPEDQWAKDLKDLNLDKDELPIERALGLLWCVETDSFKYKTDLKEQSATRRGMLSMISSIYDPFGMLAPVTLSAKIMQQELCRRKCGWDDILPPDIMNKWKAWIQQLLCLPLFQLSRCIRPRTFEESSNIQLHHFADASKDGYGTVSYIRFENDKNQVHVAFMLGKARVAPLKSITVPRMELTAAVLAARVDAMLKSELRLHIDKSVFWTDSTSVLRYISNENTRFQVFVANRISTIRESSHPSQWRHICSKENPADVASRGLKASDFIEHPVWVDGPAFLWKCEKEWPQTDFDSSLERDDPNDLEPLTPNHLLLLRGKPALPPGLFNSSDLYANRRWKQVQYISDLFWKRWVQEYLPLLQNKQKWNQAKRNLAVGDIVLVMDSSAARGSWCLGKVLEVISDNRGFVRSAKLQTKNGIFERPITKLCLFQEV